jgi:hypothetical protein
MFRLRKIMVRGGRHEGLDSMRETDGVRSVSHSWEI